MPIRADLRQHYGAAWRKTRARILARAGDKCERCGKPNGCTVEQFTDAAVMGLRVMFWRTAGSGWIDWTNVPAPATISFGKTLRKVRIVLAVAHLNHIPGDDRDDNLQALCQWCHLHHDQRSHFANARRTKAKSVGQAWLTAELEATA